jgi:hypothetical protein
MAEIGRRGGAAAHRASRGGRPRAGRQSHRNR